MTSTPCPTCQDLGWLPSKGHRFYSVNGRVCPCGIVATVAEAAARADEIRAWTTAVHQADVKAQRAARRAARKVV